MVNFSRVSTHSTPTQKVLPKRVLTSMPKQVAFTGAPGINYGNAMQKIWKHIDLPGAFRSIKNFFTGSAGFFSKQRPHVDSANKFLTNILSNIWKHIRPITSAVK